MTSGEAGALPSATAMLRSHRSCPMRRIGEPSKRLSNSSSLHAKSSTSFALSSALRTAKSGSAAAFAYLFHGHTIWQSSQP